MKNNTFILLNYVYEFKNKMINKCHKNQYKLHRKLRAFKSKWKRNKIDKLLLFGNSMAFISFLKKLFKKKTTVGRCRSLYNRF